MQALIWHLIRKCWETTILLFSLGRSNDQGTFDALGSGLLVLSTRAHRKKVEIVLKETLYALSIAFTLISISRCDDAGYQTEFAHQKCIIKNSAGKILMQAPKLNGLYWLDHELANKTAYVCLSAMEIHDKNGAYISKVTEGSAQTWHDIRHWTGIYWW